MSNKELLKFKTKYSKFLEETVNLHNQYMLFLENYSRQSGFSFRRIVKEIITVQRDLKKLSLSSYLEHRDNTKEKLSNKRKDRAYKKANPPKRGRPKKNEQHNPTTSKLI